MSWSATTRPTTGRCASRPDTRRSSRASAASGLTARLVLEYDGGGFAGWAKQPGLRTVQGVVEKALARVSDQSPSLTVAGRTDAGVHALAQVVSYEGAPAPASALNGVLPADVRVLESAAAPDGFDARHDAVSRLYVYRVYTRDAMSPFELGKALHWPHPLDLHVLAQLAGVVQGVHDFTAFTRSQTYHQRFEREVLRSDWSPAGDHVLEYRIEADTFMRGMVRVLVGTMLDVCRGRLSADDFERLLAGAPRTEAGETAPAHGLYLEAVRY